MKRALAAILMIAYSSGVFAAGSNRYQDQPPENQTREFVMACTYGVMAGTLVGAASLAFTSKPSDNLNRVARGASIGLYAGIALGLYVVYIVPGLEEGAAEEADPNVRLDNLPFRVAPTFAKAPARSGNERIDGAKADFTVLRF
jgi:hypothetical protein